VSNWTLQNGHLNCLSPSWIGGSLNSMMRSSFFGFGWISSGSVMMISSGLAFVVSLGIVVILGFIAGLLYVLLWFVVVIVISSFSVVSPFVGASLVFCTGFMSMLRWSECLSMGYGFWSYSDVSDDMLTFKHSEFSKSNIRYVSGTVGLCLEADYAR